MTEPAPIPHDSHDETMNETPALTFRFPQSLPNSERTFWMNRFEALRPRLDELAAAEAAGELPAPVDAEALADEALRLRRELER